MLPISRPRGSGRSSANRLSNWPEAGFDAPALLRNRHLQSMITQLPWRHNRVSRAAASLLAQASEEVIDCGDGVRLQGFMSAAGHERGVALLLHGWEGSAHSSYILSAGSELLDAGFSVFRLNLRDHGDTKGLNEGLFHSCRIDEVIGAVRHVRNLTRTSCFALVGQSLGGNFALRVAARAGSEGLAIDRVVAICPVLRPHSTMRALDDGFWVYRRYFLNRWRRSLAEKALAFPHLYRFGDLRRFDSLSATTEFFVEHYTEFASLDEYLSGYAVTGNVLQPLNVPSRIILAADDPVIPVEDLEDVASVRALEVTIARSGGHCGFVDRPFGSTWIDREIVADLEQFSAMTDRG